MNISQVDLNLLVVFRAVCEERNTVRAARKLGLSQPAVSHALGRLRELLGDRLFVRASHGLLPTPRALALEPAVARLLRDAEAVLLSPREFAPATSRRVFRVATTEYFEQVVFPGLLVELGRQAPWITLVTRSTLGSLPRKELESGELDLAIAGFYRDVPERFFQQKTFADDFVAVARRGILPKGPLGADAYARHHHLLISPQGDLQSKAAELLKRKGHSVHYALGTASFLSPARILAATDLVLTCPRRLAATYLEEYPLEMRELGFPLPGISLMQVWHERNHDDAGHRWFRELLRSICLKLPEK